MAFRTLGGKGFISFVWTARSIVGKSLYFVTHLGLPVKYVGKSCVVACTFYHVFSVHFGRILHKYTYGSLFDI